MDELGEAPESVIEEAARRGYTVTRAQLRRWQRFGLIEPVRQMGLGKGRGSRTFCPAGTTDRVIAIAELRREHRRFEDIAWLLWLRGHEVAPHLVLGYLQDWARWHDATLEQVREHGFSDPVGRKKERAFVAKVAAHPEAGKAFEGDLGPDRETRRQRVETLVRTSLQITTGTYEADAHYVLGEDDADGVVLTKALGLDGARKDTVLDHGPWLPEDPSEALEDAAALIGGAWMLLVADLTIEELRTARERWKGLRELITAFGTAIGDLTGADIAGFPALAAILGKETPERAALFVFFTALVARTPGSPLLKGFEQLEAIAPEWEAKGAPAYRAFQLLRDEVPGFAEALAPERVREVMGSTAAFTRLAQELQPLAAQNEPAVRDVLQRAGFALEVSERWPNAE